MKIMVLVLQISARDILLLPRKRGNLSDDLTTVRMHLSHGCSRTYLQKKKSSL